jgi:TfoX/Sxy family transcriptional regulator of competence genes
MPYDTDLAGRVQKMVGRRKGFAEKKMFGGVGFLLNGNMCVGVWKEFLIVRVGLEEYEAALEERFVQEFDITGKSLRGWVMVQAEGTESEADLKSWIESAIAFVRTLPAK